jgi:hypothetical protein
MLSTSKGRSGVTHVLESCRLRVAGYGGQAVIQVFSPEENRAV